MIQIQLRVGAAASAQPSRNVKMLQVMMTKRRVTV
jgi:hypothetical protein